MIADKEIKLAFENQFVELDGHVPALLRQVIKSVSLLRQQACRRAAQTIHCWTHPACCANTPARLDCEPVNA